MATVPMPRPTLDRAIWGTCSPCPMPTLDPYNYPIVAATPHDWYNPVVFVSGCENPANADSSGTGGGSFLYDPTEDAWMDIPHFLGMDPDYSTAGIYSHGAATFHPTGPTGTATAGSASGITVDKYLPGDAAVGATIRITGGTGAGQTRIVTATSAAARSGSYLPTYRAGSYVMAGPGTGTVSLPTPVGVQQGDLMVMEFFSTQIPPNQVTSDPSWTLAYTTWAPGASFWVQSGFVKVAGPSEPANYSWTVPSQWGRYTTYAVVSAAYVSAATRYSSTNTLDTFVWSTNVPMTGHRQAQTVIAHSRNGISSNSANGLAPTVTAGSNDNIYDISPNGELSSPYMAKPSIAFLNSIDSQCGWATVVAQATGSYTESTVLTVDSPWSVQPDNTSTYAIDSGSFWCWRGNASDSTWKWAKYDIARGVWEQKNSTDSVVAPTFVAAGALATTVSTTATVPVPAGVVDGDLMLMVCLVNQNGVTGPAGWTLLSTGGGGGGSTPVMSIYYRFASSEPASYTATLGLWITPSIRIFAYRGAGAPIPQSTVAWATGLGATHAIPLSVPSLPSITLGVGGTCPYLAATMDQFQILEGFSVLGDVTDGAEVLRSSDPWLHAVERTSSRSSAAVSYSGNRYRLGVDPNSQNQLQLAASAVVIPAATPGMSNYGKADPSYQGGIHAVTDSSDYIYLGGDAQTSLRRYSISGDSWSALTAHEPSTRPLRNVGGGMAYQTVSGDPYIFYWAPNESENAYDNTARFYAYDLTSNLWYDLLVSPGSPVSAMPSKYKRILSHGTRILWLSDRSEVVVQDPTKIDALTPDNYVALVRNAPSRSGGTPFMVTDSATDSKFLYYMEHTNVQGIQPLRCNVTGRDWV